MRVKVYNLFTPAVFSYFDTTRPSIKKAIERECTRENWEGPTRCSCYIHNYNFCVWYCRLGFDSESGQTNHFNYSQLLCLTLSINGTVWRTSRQVCFLCHWQRQLVGFPHLGVVAIWPAIPKLVRHSALIAFS